MIGSGSPRRRCRRRAAVIERAEDEREATIDDGEEGGQGGVGREGMGGRWEVGARRYVDTLMAAVSTVHRST